MLKNLKFVSVCMALFFAAQPSLSFGQVSPSISYVSVIDGGDPLFVDVLDSGDRFGRDFNPLGDLDLDGVPDFLVGARSDDDGAEDAGAVYILFMNADGSVKGRTKISATSGGLSEAGVTLYAGQFFGYAVTMIGDLDGDSVQDIAIGAKRGGATDDGGAVFVTFLNRNGTVKAVQPITNATGNLGHSLVSDDFFGESATFLGVINGAPTLAVSNAMADDGGRNRGSIFILQLNSDGSAVTDKTVKISAEAGGFGTGLVNGDQFGGRDITPLGDIDGDGNLDLAVAAFSSDDGRGAVWILMLNADFTVKAKQKIGQGAGGLQATLEVDDNFGHTVTSPGDIDGDGVPDLITSANKSDVGGTDFGELYVIYLNSDGTVKQEIRWSETSGDIPFSLPAAGRFGRALAVLGDLANDGTLCLAVGGGAGGTGTIYLLFLDPEVTPLLSDPRSIAGNVLWLDGNDPDGDFISGGDFLDDTTWVDKSSAHNASAIQLSGVTRPAVVTDAYNGLSVVHFDGGDFMDINSAALGMLRNKTGTTVFAVARPTDTTSSRAHRVFMVSTGTGSESTRVGFSFYDTFGTGLAGSGDAALNGRRLDGDSYQRINGGKVSPEKITQWTGAFDFANASLQLYGDGELLTTAEGFQTEGNTSDSNSLNIRLGADAALLNPRGFFTGDLAELIVYDRLLTVPERQKIERWLAAKWSVPVVDFTLAGSEIQFSWPVSPVGWSVEVSGNLEDFDPVNITAVRSANRMILSDRKVELKKFYRIAR